MNYANSFSLATRRMKSSLIRELVASTKNIPGLISFAGGFPSPKTFPQKQLAELYREVVLEDGLDILQYGASEGDPLLKEQLLKWEGYDLSPDNMIVTVGSTNALYCYSRALLDPGEVVLCEAPSFLGSLVTFDALKADVQSVPMDNGGIVIDALDARVKRLRERGKNIKFLYVIPDFHNPAGITYTLERRRKLIAFCIENQIPIAEDNPYSRLRFSGEYLPTLFRIAQDEFKGPGIVTEFITFSKILGPGMRIAFAKGDKELINKMVSWQQKVNVTPDCVSQRVAARFLEKGMMDPHIKGICDFYRPYLQKMLDELAKNMPSNVSWTKPEGGIFLWLTLPEGTDADELFIRAGKNKVSFIPGSKFYPPDQGKPNTLRLNFSYSTLDQMETGIRRLAELLS
ncbi:MAG: PLP-dependent aminotransferase family protein [Candidatus Syntrophosphaera sp.]